MRREPRESRLFPLVVPPALLTAAGVLALGPWDDLLRWRLWAVAAVGALAVVGLAGGVAALAAAVVRLGGRPAWAGDVALAVMTVGVGVPSVWQLLEMDFGLPYAVRFAGLVAALVAGYAVVRWVAARFEVRRRELVLPLAALFAAPLLVHAAQQIPRPPAGFTGLFGAVLAAYLAVVVVATLKGGTRRAPVILFALLATIAVLRLTTVNPQELHVAAELPPPTGEGTPIFLVVLDDFRADAADLSSPEGSATPHLARLAQQADVYPNAVANASWTLPGHSSIFTGRPLMQHRTDVTSEPGFRPFLDPAIPTAQEIFADRGYLTSGITANGLIGFNTRLARGFHRYRYPGRDWMLGTLPIKFVQLFTPYAMPELTQLIVDLSGVNRNATAEEVIGYALEEVALDHRPLYLFLNLMDVHRPFPGPPGTSLSTRFTFWVDHVRLLTGDGPPGEELEETIETARRYYYAQAERIDRELGRFFAELERRGWFDESLVVVTADHGEAFWENRGLSSYIGHTGAYEPVVRIPLIVKRPGQREGRVIADRVQQTDLLPMLIQRGEPTFLAGEGAAGEGAGGESADAGGLPADPDALGADEAIEVAGVADARSVVTEWYPRRGGHGGLLPWKRVALYRGPFKLERSPDGDRLYDLRRSPWEKEEVSAGHPELAAAMSAELDELLARSEGEGAEGEEELDPALREELKALGYIE